MYVLIQVLLAAASREAISYNNTKQTIKNATIIDRGVRALIEKVRSGRDDEETTFLAGALNLLTSANDNSALTRAMCAGMQLVFPKPLNQRRHCALHFLLSPKSAEQSQAVLTNSPLIDKYLKEVLNIHWEETESGPVIVDRALRLWFLTRAFSLGDLKDAAIAAQYPAMRPFLDSFAENIVTDLLGIAAKDRRTCKEDLRRLNLDILNQKDFLPYGLLSCKQAEVKESFLSKKPLPSLKAISNSRTLFLSELTAKKDRELFAELTLKKFLNLPALQKWYTSKSRTQVLTKKPKIARKRLGHQKLVQNRKK